MVGLTESGKRVPVVGGDDDDYEYERKIMTIANPAQLRGM